MNRLRKYALDTQAESHRCADGKAFSVACWVWGFFMPLAGKGRPSIAPKSGNRFLASAVRPSGTFTACLAHIKRTYHVASSFGRCTRL